MFGLTLQHLLDQVVDDVAVVASEAAMKPARSSRPCIESAASWSAAIQPSVRSSSVAMSRAPQVQAHHVVEVRRGLVGREPQVGGADLDELAARSQASQRQRRIGPAGDHQVHLWREMVEQEGHPVVDLAGVDDVEVVEHEHDIVRQGAELIEQRGKHRFDRRRLRRLRGAPAHQRRPGRHGPQRSDHVGPEGDGLVVTRRRAKATPRTAASADSRQPRGQQRRLPEAGGRRDERQLRLGPTAQALARAAAAARRPAAARDIQLGFEQRGWP